MLQPESLSTAEMPSPQRAKPLYKELCKEKKKKTPTEFMWGTTGETSSTHCCCSANCKRHMAHRCTFSPPHILLNHPKWVSSNKAFCKFYCSNYSPPCVRNNIDERQGNWKAGKHSRRAPAQRERIIKKKTHKKKPLLMSCPKFTITVKLGKRVKTLEGNIDNSIENAEHVCQY